MPTTGTSSARCASSCAPCVSPGLRTVGTSADETCCEGLFGAAAGGCAGAVPVPPAGGRYCHNSVIAAVPCPPGACCAFGAAAGAPIALVCGGACSVVA